VVLFTIFLLSPGCQSNPTPAAPTPAGAEPAAPASTLAALPVDENENWSNQPSSHVPAGTSTTRPAGSSASSSVSSTISSAPLPGVATVDGIRATPSRPDRPETYVSTGDREPAALNPPPTAHIIRAGDNLAKIAAKYGTTVSALQKANPGVKPQSLRVGQSIKLPAGIASGSSASGATSAPAAVSGATYTVRQGDSLSAIAARNGTTVTALRQANSLKGDTIQVGQDLIIPGGVSPAEPAPSATIYTPASPTTRSPGTISADASTTTFKHKLKSGETLGVLSKRYAVSIPEIMAANNITDARKVRAGQELVIPGYRGTSGSASASTAPSARPAAPAATPAPSPTAPAPASDPIPSAPETLPESQPLIPADMADAPPIPVDEPTPTP
jgi:LysM repeat protein